MQADCVLTSSGLCVCAHVGCSQCQCVCVVTGCGTWRHVCVSSFVPPCILRLVRSGHVRITVCADIASMARLGRHVFVGTGLCGGSVCSGAQTCMHAMHMVHTCVVYCLEMSYWPVWWFVA